MGSFDTTVNASLESVEPKGRAALQAQGFGVLTEIDVAATLRTKLGVERPALKILGACNPDFANRSLEIDPTVSLVLPCNVVVETTEVVNPLPRPFAIISPPHSAWPRPASP